jgi:hypothetical protein
MPIRKMYRLPVESSRHLQIQHLYNEYLFQFGKCMANPSRIFAQRARKALLKLKTAAHARAKEMLELYAPTKNIGKEPVNMDYKKKISNVS